MQAPAPPPARLRPGARHLITVSCTCYARRRCGKYLAILSNHRGAVIPSSFLQPNASTEPALSENFQTSSPLRAQPYMATSATTATAILQLSRVRTHQGARGRLHAPLAAAGVSGALPPPDPALDPAQLLPLQTPLHTPHGCPAPLHHQQTAAALPDAAAAPPAAEEWEVRPGVWQGVWCWGTRRVRYLRCGNHGPTVVCVHGFCASADHWMHNLTYLGQNGCRAWAIDLLGGLPFLPSFLRPPSSPFLFLSDTFPPPPVIPAGQASGTATSPTRAACPQAACTASAPGAASCAPSSARWRVAALQCLCATQVSKDIG